MKTKVTNCEMNQNKCCLLFKNEFLMLLIDYLKTLDIGYVFNISLVDDISMNDLFPGILKGIHCI